MFEHGIDPTDTGPTRAPIESENWAGPLARCTLQSLSIVIPAFNEERRLPGTLDAIRAFLETEAFQFIEVLIVDDGSRDDTAGVVRQASRLDNRIRLLQNPGNRGKGYAVRHGLQAAAGDWILFTDADLSAPIEELNVLTGALGKEPADGAIGSRALNRSLVGRHQSPLREFSGRVFNRVMRQITGLPYRDTQCGFKLLRRDVAQVAASLQRTEGFGFDVEILYIAKKRNYRILEVPVRWSNVDGTKVSLLNGLSAFADPLRIRWNDWKGFYR